MGQTKAGAVCMYVFVSVTYRNQSILVLSQNTDGYLCHWYLWVYSCEHMWVLPASECISVFKYEAESWSLLSAELNEADWNTCLTWNAIESNGPLIALHPHTHQPLLIIYPSPNAHTHHPPLSTPTCPWNARHAVHQRSFPQWVCLHKLLKYLPSIHIPHPLSPPSAPLLYVFYNPPFHLHNKHWGQCNATWVLPGNDHWFSGGMCVWFCVCGWRGGQMGSVKMAS